MTHPTSRFPKLLTVLLITSILLPIARIILFPATSGGALFWSALIGALSMSIWIGKAGAAKALGYLFYFLGFVGPASLLLGPMYWPHVVFTLIQAAVHITAARQLLKGQALASYLAARSVAELRNAHPRLRPCCQLNWALHTDAHAPNGRR